MASLKTALPRSRESLQPRFSRYEQRCRAASRARGDRPGMGRALSAVQEQPQRNPKCDGDHGGERQDEENQDHGILQILR
jgi:hypothetical protein